MKLFSGKYDFIRHRFHCRIKSRKKTICSILSYRNTNLNPEPGPDTFSTNYNFIVELSYYGYVDNGNRKIITQIIEVSTQNLNLKKLCDRCNYSTLLLLLKQQY